MKKLFIVGFIILIILANLSQTKTAVFASVSAQTVPTRTSTPEPTATSSSGGGGSSTSTNTPIAPTVTPTETPIPVTVVNTPQGGYYPTAEPCSNQPTVVASNNTNVRSGPDTTYDIVGQIVFLEVRPIIGRAQNADWWLITLSDGSEGWVYDDVVTVSGYIDIVPILDEPTGNGPLWNPTPNPNCTVTPTPIIPTDTPIPTATATAVEETIVTENTALVENPTETAVPPTEEPTLIPQPTRVSDPTGTPLPVVESVDSPNETNGTNWIFIGGIGLLLVSGIIFILRRN